MQSIYDFFKNLFVDNHAISLGPKYDVIADHGSWQIRQYKGYLVAQHPMASNREGFWPLASYIGAVWTPENRKRVPSSNSKEETEKVAMTAPVLMSPTPEKVAMTAPVLMSPAPEKVAMTAPVLMNKADGQSEEFQVMSFVLPEQYTLENAPIPNNPNIKLQQVPPKKVAVHTFSGYMNRKNTAEKADWLKSELAAAGIKPVSEYYAAGYDAPFVPAFFRRNEVMIDIE